MSLRERLAARMMLATNGPLGQGRHGELEPILARHGAGPGWARPGASPEGALVIVLLDHRAPNAEAIVEVRAGLVRAVTEAGFGEVSSELRPMKPRPAVAVVARRPN